MDIAAYRAVTAHLTAWAASTPEVLALIAQGSMAERSRLPDEWSDHDFWVVAVDGAAEPLRTSTDWLPDPDRIVLHVRETDHGVKVVYDDGHLLEPAIFEVAELAVTRTNEYRVLVDKAGLADQMAAIAAATTEEAAHRQPTDGFLFGQFVTNLLVGVGRWARGEHQSGRVFVKQHAVAHLLELAARHCSPQAGVADNLDPNRRIEILFPELARKLSAALTEDVPRAAEALLALGEWVAPDLFSANEDAVRVVGATVGAVADTSRSAGN